MINKDMKDGGSSQCRAWNVENIPRYFCFACDRTTVRYTVWHHKNLLKGKSFRTGGEYVTNLLKIPITFIVNLSPSSGKVPHDMKVATVKPLYIMNSSLEAGNYRPVSILSILSKILEKCVHSQLHLDLELPYTPPSPPGGFCKGIFFWKPIQNSTKWAMLALWRLGRLGFLG